MKSTIKRDKQRIKETKDTTAKTVETCSTNDAWRQGDIEIRFLNYKPQKLEKTKIPTQLAPGTTKGSRHILQTKTVEAFKFKNATPLEGPVLHCPQGLTVTHPEHGDITINEPGWYVITYQRAFSNELKRQLD